MPPGTVPGWLDGRGQTAIKHFPRLQLVGCVGWTGAVCCLTVRRAPHSAPAREGRWLLVYRAEGLELPSLTELITRRWSLLVVRRREGEVVMVDMSGLVCMVRDLWLTHQLSVTRPLAPDGSRIRKCVNNLQTNENDNNDNNIAIFLSYIVFTPGRHEKLYKKENFPLFPKRCHLG